MSEFALIDEVSHRDRPLGQIACITVFSLKSADYVHFGDRMFYSGYIYNSKPIF
jgi:hypothetical protein